MIYETPEDRANEEAERLRRETARPGFAFIKLAALAVVDWLVVRKLDGLIQALIEFKARPHPDSASFATIILDVDKVKGAIAFAALLSISREIPAYFAYRDCDDCLWITRLTDAKRARWRIQRGFVAVGHTKPCDVYHIPRGEFQEWREDAAPEVVEV